MEVAVLTVDDEVLAGDIANTNAKWLANCLTDRDATVDRVLEWHADRVALVSKESVSEPPRYA